LTKQGYKLVITGPRGNSSAELLPAIEVNPFVQHLGYVGNPQLSTLYSEATALFFPSLVEGFGVPALEATRLGTIAIVSKGTVLEEVVGPAGLTVDPRDRHSMISGLQKAAALSQTERADLIADVAAYQSRFSVEEFRSAWAKFLP